jgi:hypothetical protein
MKRRFRVQPGGPPSPLEPVGFLSAPLRREAVTPFQVVSYKNSHLAPAKHADLKKLMQRLTSAAFAQGVLKGLPIRKSDPYILLLLAEQELEDGREEQAIYLVEAAYEGYDQRNESCVYGLRPVA